MQEIYGFLSTFHTLKYDFMCHKQLKLQHTSVGTEGSSPQPVTSKAMITAAITVTVLLKR